MVGCLDIYLRRVEDGSETGPSAGRVCLAEGLRPEAMSMPALAGRACVLQPHTRRDGSGTGRVQPGVYPGRVHPMHPSRLRLD